jgi:hypothetical protein
LTSSKGAIPWDQRSAISLAEYERCLVVVAPVFAGKGGVFDTESCQLIPVSVQL